MIGQIRSVIAGSPSKTNAHEYNDSNHAIGLSIPTPASQRHGHRRTLSLSRFSGPKRAVWTLGTFALLALVTLWLWSSQDLRNHNGGIFGHEEWDGGPIPLGQSRYRGGREYFWWEQFHRFTGYFQGRNHIVPSSDYVPEQQNYAHGDSSSPISTTAPLHVETERQACYLDAAETIAPPLIAANIGLPQGMPAPLFGSHAELGLRGDVCYDRINRYAPYGFGVSEEQDGLGIGQEGDIGGLDGISQIDWRKVNWNNAQKRCVEKNARRGGRNAFVLRTWHTFQYTPYHTMMLRAIISELALASGGEYTVHFLVHVQDDSIPIWASEETYARVLNESLPAEFHGMATLWSVAQMKLIYPPPFPESTINFSGGDIYDAYRSLHFPMQYFASQHPEYEYFWQWEMDTRITGHYLAFLNQISKWADKQRGSDYLWERSAKFYVPSLYNDTYSKFVEAVKAETFPPISGSQVDPEQLLPIPAQLPSDSAGSVTDFITMNPMFDPERTGWAFKNDITGYGAKRPPTRASLVTVSRSSRRLLVLMHEETFRHKHTMFPEMYPASIALQYGLKAVYVPHPVYSGRHWPGKHADHVFNNAQLDDEARAAGMGKDRDFFHGPNGSVFGPGEHVFRTTTYYSNAWFAGYLWRRWLGRENEMGELDWEMDDGDGGGGGRMCLPMMLIHPVKYE